MKKIFREYLFSSLMITFGCAVYAFAFVNFNMKSRLAEGGISGVILIFHALTGLNPAISQILFNLPLIALGFYFLGRRSLIFTIYGIGNMAFFLWIFQRIPITIPTRGDLLIASLLAGVFAGFGLGIVLKFGGTTGGGDIIAKILQERKGLPISRTFFVMDSIVLTASLSYIDLQHMMYTLICAFVASQVIEFVQSGGYTVRGMLIISSQPEQIASKIMDEMGRGVTYLTGEGAYSGEAKRVIYVVLNPREIQEMRSIIEEIDDQAFTSIINVHEVIGDFVYANKRVK